MFYLIEFDNVDSKATKELMFELNGYPNGTILSNSLHINVPILPTNKWIVWIDKNNMHNFDEQFEFFSNIKEIKSFIELDVQKSPNDADWLWDDNYINNIFSDYL